MDLQFARSARVAPPSVATSTSSGPPEWLVPFPRVAAGEETSNGSLWSRVLSAARRAFGKNDGEAPPPQPLLPPEEATAPVPEFVRDAARESGVELAGLAWTLSDDNRAGVPRAVFDVHAPDAGEAYDDRYLVKVAWHPQVNAGIENEHLALRALTTRAPVPAGTFPKPAFFAIRSGVVLAGQHVIPGRSFRECTDGTPTCARAERSLDWLVEIAAGAFRPRETLALAEPLEEIVERYAAAFGPSAETSRFLHTQAEMLFSAGSLPTVLHHGDPDPARNVRINEESRPAFLGWEECALEGLPLWDLYWFAQGYGRLASEMDGARWSPQSYETQFLQRTLYSVMLVRAVAASCERLALSPRLAEPLFHLGWATRAVRGGPEADVFATILERSVAASQRDGGLALFNG